MNVSDQSKMKILALGIGIIYVITIYYFTGILMPLYNV
jgi:hypothetical protein